jgi:hypothetical protein
MVVANAEDHWVKDGASVRHVPPNLSTLRIFDDGRREFRHRYDEDPEEGAITWTGVISH